MRPLSHAACSILSSLSRTSELVFSSGKTGKALTGYRSSWDRIVRLAVLPGDVTLHVLRHSFASTAAELDYSELTIAALIGHKSGSITSLYVHHADATLLAVADAVADEIARRMGDKKPSGDVIELRRA
jgi:integrase